MSRDGMAKKKSKTVFVRWVRSGIGFSYHQKRMVRSLGLRRLNHIVELEDTPSVRGLVARIPHLVEITGPPAQPSHASVPEYTIRVADAAPVSKTKSVRKKKTPVSASQTASGSPAPETPEKSEE